MEFLVSVDVNAKIAEAFAKNAKLETTSHALRLCRLMCGKPQAFRAGPFLTDKAPPVFREA
jgi:hypothetical protein